jgi:hypothetical protein
MNELSLTSEMVGVRSKSTNIGIRIRASSPIERLEDTGGQSQIPRESMNSQEFETFCREPLCTQRGDIEESAGAKMTIFLIGLRPAACGESTPNSCSQLENISKANLPAYEGLDDSSDQDWNPPGVTRWLHRILRNCRFWSVDFSSLHVLSKPAESSNLNFGRADDIP